MAQASTPQGILKPSNNGVPRTRQRKHKTPPPLDVPDIDDDAAERKRVLNVLAQRRYRERKRQDRLKPKSKGKSAAPRSEIKAPEPPEAIVRQLEPELADEEIVPQETEIDTSFLGFDEPAWTSSKDMGISSMAMFPGALPTSGFLGEEPYDQTTAFFGSYATPSNTTAMSPDSLLDSSRNSPSAAEQTAWSPPSHMTGDSDFPDSFLLPVHELTILRGLMRIAKRIGVDTTTIWSLDSPSPFTLGKGTPTDQLPQTWHPTITQLTIPHHPIMDFLPWPGARDRLISMMSMPDSARPAHASGPLALVNFAYDLEDNSEGVRIYGSDPCDPNSWEVGQVFFERWWFIFDREIIDNSNKWRRLRGAPPLLLKA